MFTQTGGTFTIQQALLLGRNGGSGTYLLDGGVLASSSGTQVGNGDIIQSGGMLTGGEVLVGTNPGENGGYELQGGSLAVGSISVGYSGTGTFTQSGGKVGASAGSQLYVGSTGTGKGTYNLEGGSLVTTDTYVGYGGTGVFNQSGGAHTITGGGLHMALTGGSSGTYNLDGGVLATSSVQLGQGTGVFNFNGGTLQALQNNATFFSPAFLQGAALASVRAGGAIIDTNGFNVTVAQALLHDASLGGTADGGLTKNGTGTLTLSGINTYTGPTTINGGTLAVASAASVGGDTGANGIFFNGSATLLATASLTLDQNLTFRTDATATSVSTTATFAAAPGATLTLQPALVNDHSNIQLVFGSAGNTGTVILTDPVGFGTQGGTYGLTVAAGTLRAGGSFGVPYLTSLNASTTVAAGATLDYNSFDARTMTFTPVLRNLQGAGTVLTGGDATTNITIGAGNFSGVIAGPGQITNTTFDSLTLSGPSTYAGGTTIGAGTLLVNNTTGSATGSGGVSVNAGGVLGGRGAISGSVSVAGGATTSPGGGIGTLSTGNLSLSPGSTLQIELDPANVSGNGTNDQLDVTGSVLLAGSDLALSLLSAPILGEQFSILLNDGTDPVTGEFAQGATVDGTFDGKTYLFSIDYLTNADGGRPENDVSLVAVPEPRVGTGLLLLIALAVWMGRQAAACNGAPG